MGIFGMTDLNNLNDLFIQQLGDLYDAEKQLTKALPHMADAANSADLKEAFQHHLTETEGHVQRLEGIFNNLGRDPHRETCAAMKGLITEGEEMISAGGNDAVRDAGLIAAAQRVEHYEMAGYGTLRSFAQQLHLEDVAQTLQQTLDEEGKANEKLTQIAENDVNSRAGQIPIQ
jgi:ferritin-like metal-binding protein YciE